ncbi:MAG: GLPGLI family protein [Flavobacterium sp.]|jgi:GLPGLI family protein|nr:GLPGLI family protein [Flavobacterium sp.]
MNTIKIFITVLFLTTSLCFSQENYSIIYNTYPTYGSIEDEEVIKNSKVNYIYKGLDQAIKITEFQLDINRSESFFYFKDKLYEDDKIKRLAKTFCGSSDFYINTEKNLKIKINYFAEKKYFINDTTRYDWTIYNESKIIDNKICYKATTINKTLINDTIKEKEIVAWFYPEIPISFGPKGYDGLPGLIMELQDDKVTFVVNQILKDSKIKISKQDYKTIISEKEFNEIVKEIRDKFLEDNNIRKL